MNTYQVDLNTKLTSIYYNGGKPNLFRVWVDVTLSELKDQLDQINHRLNNMNTRRMDNVKYHRPSTNSNGSVQFTHIIYEAQERRGRDNHVLNIWSLQY
jgi:hypothetical protein